jgi:hypothetical protein
MQALAIQAQQSYLLRLDKNVPDDSLDKDYWAHAGQIVTVAHITPASGPFDLESYDVRAADGWTGIVFASELFSVEDGSL